MNTIRNVAVIGSGVMGSGIAAHLANAGLNCLLLDTLPAELSTEEKQAGLTLDHPKVRNRLADAAVARMRKSASSPLYSEDFAHRIRTGNMEDHIGLLSQMDWIIEVVTESLPVKQQVLASIERVWKPGTIVSSNTSGISINEMSKACSEAFRSHFLGTHFFNPPRYMKLLEIIPGHDTKPEIVRFMMEFCEKTLGKGVVVAKDTPNFIANRIGTYGLMITLHEMLDQGYTVEEVDAVTGPVMGRPNSATLRTLDLVGLDVAILVAKNMQEMLRTEAEKSVFTIPKLLRDMVARGWLGEKSGQGFYRKVKSGGKSEIHALNLSTMEYEPGRKVTGASLDAARAARSTEEKLRALLAAQDRYSELAWTVLKRTFLYAAQLLGEIADSITDIDNAMKWGFNWEFGPFEMWDIIGLRDSVRRMEQEGERVPAWVKDWLARGHESFYQKRSGYTYYCHDNEYIELARKPELISLKALREQGKTILAGSAATLIDLGDEVACLELHGPNNTINEEVVQMVVRSLEEVRRHYRGLVIASEGRHFCVGANLLLMLQAARNAEWDVLDEMIRGLQDAMMLVKRFEKPVVAAPHSMTLGGGVELCLPADRIVFSAETYFGLVETGVGLIPAGGGCKEMLVRINRQADHPNVDLQPYVHHLFETIAMGKVSTSGHDTRRLGFMRETDRVILNQDYRVYEAKQAVLALDREGYVPQQESRIRALGDNGRAVMQMTAYTMRRGGYISDHDYLIASKLAHVLAGGSVPEGTLVSEQFVLDLEREAFLSLCGEPKTQQRIEHMLKTRKPLRN
jgi:3-hydroxyacyl-CoA dehydrogenase